MDFAKHNEEVRALWKAYEEGKPPRAPVVFNIGTRYGILTPDVNTRGITFEQYFKDPDSMMLNQLERQHYVRSFVPQDAEMGDPAVEWGGISTDFQNLYEAAWLGCEIRYCETEVPDTVPLLVKEKGRLYDMSIPDPLHENLMGWALEYYQYFEEKRKGFEFRGKPVGKSGLCGGGTDGPFTVACSVRGATEVCTDILEDPKYFHDLMDFVTEATIARIKAVLDYQGINYPMQCWGFADDSIQLLSPAMYRDHVLPYHRRLVATFSKGGPNSIHLCGAAQQHFQTLQKELNIQSFDTGFPTDLGRARRELGPGVLLRGNVHPELLRKGPAGEIERAVREVLSCGVMEGGRFHLCEGNNVVPATPIAHFQAMYDAGKRYGAYPPWG